MSSLRLMVTCVIAVFLVPGSMYLSYEFFAEVESLSKILQVLSIVNVLFTGLAFSAAGIAVYFQSIQLRDSRKGLAEAELVQSKTMENQFKMLEIQRLQAEALIKSKQVEITAILKSSQYNLSIDHKFKDEIEEIINKINKTAERT
ncbi:hypothetical protein VXS03_07045 [Photobacterium sp. S4TG1]|uniref:hypothetical protein n=1 Tax=Photobacterium sp. S4TG1 TaxID=3114587 RepID=UPI002E18EE3F|nr:hypothetical protein [Photobacterium sp. S4TG1]